MLTGFSRSPYTLLIRIKKMKLLKLKKKERNFNKKFGERNWYFSFNKKFLNILQNKKIVAVDDKLNIIFIL